MGKVPLRLNGSAFVLLRACRRAAAEQGWQPQPISDVRAEAASSTHLVGIQFEHTEPPTAAAASAEPRSLDAD